MKRVLPTLAAVLVVTACGDSATGPRTSQPGVSAVTPNWGSAGTEVTINGSGFATDSISVFFGDTKSPSAAPLSAAQVRAIVPDGLIGGTLYDIRVVNRDGGVATLASAFEFVVPPAIDSVAPTVGTWGTEVAIHGAAFALDSVEVLFGGTASPRVINESGVLFALVPAGLQAEQSYDVRVINRNRAADTLVAGFETVAPRALRINGVSRPTGIKGMTIIIDGSAFGDSLALAQGKVFFEATNGSLIEAPIADPANDWGDSFIVTRVPDAVGDTSLVWVETATGVSRKIEFTLIQSGVFSPSLINWTKTTALPQPLQGLGAAFVPVEDGATPANYIFTVGGADSLNLSTAAVYRATVAQSGTLGGSWAPMTALPAPRAYHATVAATAYTAALDTTTTGAILYVIGGKDAAGSTVSSVHYARVDLNGAVGNWQDATPLPQPLHSGRAVMFRGFIYLTGGATPQDSSVGNVYRARVGGQGELGQWEPIASLPTPLAYHSLVNFGPYIFAVGGETSWAPPVRSTMTNTETAKTWLVRLNMRNGSFAGAWAETSAMAKARSKHGTIFGGGSLFVTSGLYSGQAGSSENTYAVLNSDGTLQSWQGATGAEIIQNEIGWPLYNQAMVTFIDQQGNGRVLVLGGADRNNAGRASAEVVYY
jgi:hypothetical protein